MAGIEVAITRRSALLAATGLAASGAFASAENARAEADKQGPLNASVARYAVGAFEVTTLLDGAGTAREPQKTFGMNVDAATFRSVSSENFISADEFVAFFTPTLVNTGHELVLFDTGLGEQARPGRGNMRAALISAGYLPEQVDIVVITHMHPDHIGGLTEGGVPAFPNARYVIGQREYDFWAAQDPEANGIAKLMAAKVKPLSAKMTFLGDGDSVVSGITAVAAYGHTPGHMAYMLDSNGTQLLLAADTANHFVWSLAYPDWDVRFDMNKEAAATTRKQLLGMLAADKIPFVGYHMPFPSVGYVAGDGTGFRYVPTAYQMRP